MRQLGRQTVVRLRAPRTDDRYGNDFRDWDNQTELEIPGCSIQPLEGGTVSLAGSESVDHGAVVTRWRLYGPAGTDLLSSDRVRHPAAGGQVYDIQGDVQEWEAGTPRAYTTCLLERSDDSGDEEG